MLIARMVCMKIFIKSSKEINLGTTVGARFAVPAQLNPRQLKYWDRKIGSFLHSFTFQISASFTSGNRAYVFTMAVCELPQIAQIDRGPRNVAEMRLFNDRTQGNGFRMPEMFGSSSLVHELFSL